ncbi:type II toxin-antitoxin system Phd/YefM family antitoxin [Gilvimarinus xylanilyticus]|uniref:Antitoxin n=1 Tax=Gilvimarinus xylanilyticus TaxID=2944139 RepID=A0A9X2I4I5_9GAMM|nr:type II toxin-antitoxin system Phd/YefM family antitoxin [Gilvimarinus xylanilyticus]MCP8900215.1 type II toxin-antitoxin system Phd/YefM family antitoxin [Gilvimarinus xylanilyticus]
MSILTVTSREFNQHASEAKRAAANGPVFITTRGKPAHVLLTYEEYQRLTGGSRSVADLLAAPGAEDVELPITKAGESARSAEL